MRARANAGDRVSTILAAGRELLERAGAASAQAYAPYSKFRVGAALRTAAGAIFTGCNVENASYGLTNCAERAAIFTAVTAEGPAMRIAAIAIVVNGTRQAFPPCGACRQVIAEFAAPEAVVVYRSARGKLVRTTIGELLPQAFAARRAR
jgi:homotetrameric cytidine deaminase